MRTLPFYALVLTTAVSSPSAQNQRLSHTPPPDFIEGITGIQVEGSHVAFQVREPTYPAFPTSLWTVDIARSTPPRFHTSTKGVYCLTPDGRRLIHRESKEDGIFLRTVRLDGSTEGIIGNSVDLDRDPLEIYVTPDSSRIVFLAATDEGLVHRLFSAPANGTGSVVELSGAFFAPGRVQGFEVSPPAGLVVYRVREGGELYSRQVDGSGASRFLVDGTSEFRLTLDGSSVIFSQRVGGRIALSMMAVDGSLAPVRLSPEGIIVVSYEFLVTPDDGRLLYLSDTGLRSVDLGSGSERLLSSEVTSLSSVQVSPDGQRVLFADDIGIALTPAGGGPLTRLWIGSADSHSFSPDSNWLAFEAGGSVYLAPGDASETPRRLETGLSSAASFPRFSRVANRLFFFGGDLNDLHSIGLEDPASPSRISRTVHSFWEAECGAVVTSDRDSVPAPGLWSTPDGGESRVRLNPPLRVGLSGDVSCFAVEPHGRRAWYVAARGGGGSDLWSVRLDDPRRALWHFPAGAEQGMEFSPDGRWLLLKGTAWFALHRTDDGGRNYSSSFEAEPRFAADSSQLVFSRGAVVRVSLDTTPAETVFTDTRVDSTQGPSLVLAPLAERAVFVREFDPVNRWRLKLWSVALDGASPAVLLTPTMVEGGTIGGNGILATQQVRFQLTADGSHVVYVADQTTDGVNELFRVPIDGTGLPVRISAPMVSGGDVLAQLERGPGFALSPDGVHAVYLADQEVDGRIELYRTEILGVSTAVRLSQPLVAGGSVGGQHTRTAGPHGVVSISADGTWVVYMADAEVDRMDELYAVPLDGSAMPHKLNAPLATNGNVVDFELQTSGLALYRTKTTGTIELFSAPIDGSASALRLGEGLEWIAGAGSTSRERGFRLSPDGSEVWFFARPGGRAEIGLFVAPLDGSRPAREASGTMAPGGNATGSDGMPRALFTPDGNRILYLADQEQDGLFELFGTWQRRAPREAPPPR